MTAENSCPAATMGRRQQMILAAIATAEDEAEAATDPVQRRFAEYRRAGLEAQLEQLEEGLSWQCAESLEGALRSLFVAALLVDDFAALAFDATEKTEAAEKLRRCLYSIRHAIARKVRLDVDAIGGDFYMPGYLNPFTSEGVAAAA